MGAEVSMLITLVTAVSVSITQPAIVDAALSILASELISLEKDDSMYSSIDNSPYNSSTDNNSLDAIM